MIKAVAVRVSRKFTLEVKLEDGRMLEHEMSYLDSQSGPVADALKDVKVFDQVRVIDGIVCWPSGYDIDPYFLVESSRVLSKTPA